MAENFMGLDGFHWFVGVVESRQDPSQLGRVQVRVLGIHTDNKTSIPTEDLPWATCMAPTTSSSNSGIGTSPSFIVEGSWVVGFFMDVEKQQPIIMGTLPGIPNQAIDTNKGFNDPNGVYPKELNQSDVNKLARGISTISKTPDEITNEPNNPYNATYPNNHVFESESGHVIEFDDTPNAERIHVYHKSGTFIEMHPNGDIVTQHKNGFKTVSGNDNVHITGSANLTVDETLNIKAKDIIINSETTTETYTTKTETATTGNITFTSGDVQASSISLIGHQHRDNPGLAGAITTIPIGGSASTVTTASGTTATAIAANLADEEIESLDLTTIETVTLPEISTSNLADNAITQDKIADDAVGSGELKTLSTLRIKDSSGSTLKTVHGAGE